MNVMSGKTDYLLLKCIAVGLNLYVICISNNVNSFVKYFNYGESFTTELW